MERNLGGFMTNGITKTIELSMMDSTIQNIEHTFCSPNKDLVTVTFSDGKPPLKFYEITDLVDPYNPKVTRVLNYIEK